MRSATGNAIPVTTSVEVAMDLGAFRRKRSMSGAITKIRAMDIIEELEPTRRGPYAGAVGYFGFSGNMDMCINIRTIVIKGRQASIQAGAGIVADSNPVHEYEETYNKARAMMKAIELAEQGLE